MLTYVPRPFEKERAYDPVPDVDPNDPRPGREESD